MFWYVLITLVFANTQNMNMHVLYKGDLVQDGSKIEFLVDVSDINNASVTQTDYITHFDKNVAKSVITSVVDVSSEKKTTVLVFDDSASMQQSRPLMIAAAKEYLNSLDPQQKQNHTIDIMLGAVETKYFAQQVSIAQALTMLDTIPPAKQQNTALRDVLQDAIKESAKFNPASQGGTRQVILFSDGLEETTLRPNDVKPVIGLAQNLGVQVHFLFTAPNKQRTTLEMTNIQIFQSISESTGGIDATEQVRNGQGALNNGAQKIANKIGKVRRITIDLCEAQQTQDNLIKIQYGANDYAWIEHRVQKNAITEAQCPCVPACNSQETCTNQQCIPNPNASVNSGTQWPWWLLLLLGLPLLGLLWKNRKKTSSSIEPVAIIPEEQIEQVEPPPDDISKTDDTPITFNMLAKLYRGPWETKTFIQDYTLMHQSLIFGRPVENASLQPTHPIELPEISKHHLKVFLDVNKTLYVQEMGSRSIVSIQEKSTKKSFELGNWEKFRLDYQKDIVCLYRGEKEEEDLYLEFLLVTEKEPHVGSTYNPSKPSLSIATDVKNAEKGSVLHPHVQHTSSLPPKNEQNNKPRSSKGKTPTIFSPIKTNDTSDDE